MITRLTEKIWIVEGGKNGQYPFSHSLYVRDGGGFLIDAASDRAEIERLRKEEGISTVVMSHYHEDHFTFLSALPGIEVWTTAEDAPGFGSIDVLLSLYGVYGTEWEQFKRKQFLDQFHFRPAKVTRTVSDGEELRFGKTRAVAVVAPGHTAGHLCLHFPDDGIVFLGDYDLSAFGPVYSDAASGIGAFRQSVRRLAKIDANTWVVSHGKPVHQGTITEKAEKYLSVIDHREEALREFLRESHTREEIIAGRLIYGAGYEGLQYDFGEWVLLSKHLEEMIARGEVSLHEGAYVLT